VNTELLMPNVKLSHNRTQMKRDLAAGRLDKVPTQVDADLFKTDWPG
jgi:hypothetical protein